MKIRKLRIHLSMLDIKKSKRPQNNVTAKMIKAIKLVLLLPALIGLFLCSALVTIGMLLLMVNHITTFGGIVFWLVAVPMLLLHILFLIIGFINIRSDLSQTRTLDLEGVIVWIGLICGLVLTVMWIFDESLK